MSDPGKSSGFSFPNPFEHFDLPNPIDTIRKAGKDLGTRPIDEALKPLGVNTKQVVEIATVVSAILPIAHIKIINLIVRIVTKLLNEISQGALNGETSDANYAARVLPPHFASRPVEVQSFSTAVNQLLTRAFDLEAQLAGFLATTATAVNRYFSSCLAGHSEMARVHLQDAASWYAHAQNTQGQTAEALVAAAQAIVAAGADTSLDKSAFQTFQAELLRTGALPPDLEADLRSSLTIIDPNLQAFINPTQAAFEALLSLRPSYVPDSFAGVLVAEAAGMVRLTAFCGPVPGVHNILPVPLAASAPVAVPAALGLNIHAAPAAEATHLLVPLPHAGASVAGASHVLVPVAAGGSASSGSPSFIRLTPGG
jgi:hypothetical protein